MIAIIKYNAGNTASVKNAVERLGYECIITDNEKTILSADKVILPGVGEASTAMKYLREKNLDLLIPTIKKDVLGICLGLQLLCSYSEEGNTDCLKIFDINVKKFDAKEIVPHMGWNNLNISNNSGILKGITVNDDVYFVHSYYAELSKYTIANCDYILPFSAVIQRDNFYACQFHPEKSGDVGNRILKNFLEL